MQNRNSEFKNKNSGITLLELLVALGIIIAVSFFSVSALKNSKDSYVLSSAREEVLTGLQNARAKTLASQDASQFGVHFIEDRIIIFQGAVYEEGAASNETLILPSGAVISSINLGGPIDVVFGRLTGAASPNGSILVSLRSDSSVSTTINILDSGIAY